MREARVLASPRQGNKHMREARVLASPRQGNKHMREARVLASPRQSKPSPVGEGGSRRLTDEVSQEA